MSDDHGYFKLSRKLFDGSDEFWPKNRPFTRFEAWIDMIQMAAYKAHERMIGNQSVKVETGQIVASSRFLAKRWGWGRQRVRGFLQSLRRQSRVTTELVPRLQQKLTRITLTKYETYQVRQPLSNPRATHEQPASNPNRSKGKERKGRETKLPAVPDSLDTPDFRNAWAEFIAYRKASTHPSVTPRAASMTLKKLEDLGPEAGVRAIETAIANDWRGVVFPDKQRKPGPLRSAGSYDGLAADLDAATEEWPA